MAMFELHAEVSVGPLGWEVPRNQSWQILFGHVIFTSSATGGNRWIKIEALDNDGTSIMWDCHAGAKQTSSLVRQYNYRPGAGRETAFVDSDIVVDIPVDAVLLPGWQLKLFDDEAIDEANDTFTAHFLVDRKGGSDRRRFV